MPNPFVEGATIGYRHGNHSPWQKRKVEKVYKNGNFKISNHSKQWKPDSYVQHWNDGKPTIWRAVPAGNEARWFESVRFWDEHLEAEIKRDDQELKLRVRAHDVREKLQYIHRWYDEQLISDLEKAINGYNARVVKGQNNA